MKAIVRLWPSAWVAVVGSISGVMPVQAAGMLEDAAVNLNMRNLYFNRNYLEHTDPAANAGHGQAEAWTQSFILDLRSGYSEGDIGFAVEALGLASYKLDGNRAAANTQLLPMHDDGQAADSFGRVALAAKAKYSKTELKVGEWMVITPLLRSDDARSLPQTFKGGQITSNELAGLTLIAARFNGNSQRNDAGMQRMSFSPSRNQRVSARAFNLLGAEYRFNRSATMLAAWHAELVDVYKQSFLQLTHSWTLGAWAFASNLGYFNGSEVGAAKAGQLDNKVYQGSLSAKIGASTFTLGYQQLKGHTQFLRIDGTSAAALINDSFTAGFDNPNERSWQLRHDYSFARHGLPGLSVMNRYISGSHIHSKAGNTGEEWGRETELSYTVQSGSLKNLNLRWRNMSVRRAAVADGQDFNENRLIVSYPLNLL